MPVSRDAQTRTANEAAFRELESVNPAWTVPTEPAQFIPTHHAKIGIEYDPPVAGRAFLKLHAADFIVEEIAQDGSIVDIGPNDRTEKRLAEAKQPRIGATLVKTGIDTVEAVERLAKALAIEPSEIGYAGLKDSKAVTAQEISVNRTRVDGMESIAIPNLFLKDVGPRVGVINPGGLRGNRFAIHVRSDGTTDVQAVERRYREAAAEGFLNFYSLQRFGLRLNGQVTGRHILRADYEAAVRELLLGASPHEPLVMQEMRKEASGHWGRWDAMLEVFRHLPYSFYFEITALESLARRPFFDAALRAIPDQVRLCVNGYRSYCFNRLLSHAKHVGAVPDRLPVISADAEVKKTYEAIMDTEEIAALRHTQDALPLLAHTRPQPVTTRVAVDMLGIKQTPYGFAFHFDLQKGAYATTVLSQIFHLYQGRPIPEWVTTDPFDSRPLFGFPPIAATLARFPAGSLIDENALSD